MDILLQIIIIIASILLTFLVFAQNPKGGGLSSDFSAAQQLGGVKNTNEFVVKATWVLAGTIMLFSIILTVRTKSSIPDAVQPHTEQQAPGQPGQPAQPAPGQQ